MISKITSEQIDDFIDIEGEKGSLRFRIITSGNPFPFPDSRITELQIDNVALKRLYDKAEVKR